MAHSPGILDAPRSALLDRLAGRMLDGDVPDDVRRAVDVLTAAADPRRADRLAVEPGEAAVAVERLAVWALHRTTDRAVATASRMLAAAGEDESERDRQAEDASCRYSVAV